jgi:2-polyprenyl-3-methyl-5-hydroxy-6-metoxy-1,4-benzoquinol methylase
VNLFTKGLVWVFNLGHKYSDPDYEEWEYYTRWPTKLFKRKLVQNTLALIEDLPSMRILSLGCGSSPILGVLKCSKVGVDINPEKLLVLRRNHPEVVTYCYDITRMQPIGQFDVVLLNEVIEHTGYDNTDQVLRLVSDSLLDSGRAVISMPDMDNRLGNLLERTFHKDIHISMLSGRDLIARCKKVGLKFVAKRNWQWDTAFLFVKESA